jgi:hypothetical protein
MSTEAPIVIGIDPGPEHSAYATIYASGKPGPFNWIENNIMLGFLKGLDCDHLGIETLHPRGEPVSLQAMQGQLWAGRFIEALGVPFTCVCERDAAFACTGTMQAKAANISQGLKNIFGEDRRVPCGCDGTVPGKRGPKKCPRCKGKRFVTEKGPLAGANEHVRSALAVAYYVWQKRRVAA